MLLTSPYRALLIIPTGIGSQVGGYAGDAIPMARLFAAAVDQVITHPNVLNGASLFWPMPTVLYVEGYGLDRFCQGAWILRPVRQNRVGVLFDAAIEPDLQLRQQQVIQAAQATLGLAITDGLTTDTPLGISVSTAPSGSSQGSLQAPDALLRGAHQLVAQGCQAIALVTRFPETLDFDQYQQAQGVDPLAGVEAILSHLLVREFRIPCAHAPVLRATDPPLPVHPRAAAEEIGFTFLPSVLAGLSYAPQFRLSEQPSKPEDITAQDLDVVIAPATAFGGPGILSLASRPDPPLFIAVEENATTMQVTPEALGIRAVRVRTYLEAIGVVVAHRAGIALKSVRLD